MAIKVKAEVYQINSVYATYSNDSKILSEDIKCWMDRSIVLIYVNVPLFFYFVLPKSAVLSYTPKKYECSNAAGDGSRDAGTNN